MEIKKWAMSHLKNGIANEEITLRGELIISQEDMLALTDGDYKALQLQDDWKTLKQLIAGLKIEKNNGICDMTIKIFAFNGKVDDANLFQKLQQVFTDIAEKVYAAKMTLRLDVVGEFTSMGCTQKFRFLNQQTKVAWKVTEEQNQEKFFNDFRKKIVQKLDTQGDEEH